MVGSQRIKRGEGLPVLEVRPTDVNGDVLQNVPFEIPER